MSTSVTWVASLDLTTATSVSSSKWTTHIFVYWPEVTSCHGPADSMFHSAFKMDRLSLLSGNRAQEIRSMRVFITSSRCRRMNCFAQFHLFRVFSRNQKATSLCAALANVNETDWELALQRFTDPSFESIRAAIGDALGCTKIPAQQTK